jgi:hypothetical protein
MIIILLAVGAYLITVGVKGNADKLGALIKSSGGFVSWIAVILFLNFGRLFLSSQIVDAFLVLAGVAFVLKNRLTLQANFKDAYSYLGGNSGGASGAW